MSFVKHIFNVKSPEEIKLEDIQRLIDNKIEEFLHLDYEEIPSKNVRYEGLSEHISGFLNTSGGIVIFGLSEQKGRFPLKFTWTNIKKETLENNLFSKVQPWDEGIRILPIQNPDDENLRVFVIYVPKSKNPPHMANHRYYLRLNFQTKPLGHEQVSGFFRQRYFMKSNLIKSVYGPIYNELVTYYNQNRIKKWTIANLERILRENRFLLSQDEDIAFKVDVFLGRLKKWNSSLDVVPFRLTKIINSVASNFFNADVYDRITESAIRLNIKAESSVSSPTIDRAILNNKHPIDFWKAEHEFSDILEIKIELQINGSHLRKDYITKNVSSEDFEKFLIELKKEVDKDDLIKFIWKEFKDMQGLIETYFFEELQNRMQ